MTATPIDAAHAALEAAGDDPALRMAFFGQVMAGELYLVLEEEPDGDRIKPLVLDTEAGRLVLAFDLPERMAAFLEAPRAYAALAGRSLVAMLAGQAIGIALNLEVASSESVISPEAVDWLAATPPPGTARAERIVRFRTPASVPTPLVAALEARLGSYLGRVQAGYLAAADYADGSEGMVLALAGVPPEGEAAVAAAIDEASRFSGAEGVRLDVVFPEPAALQRVARVGIAFRPEPPQPPERSAPGRDAERPPRLR